MAKTNSNYSILVDVELETSSIKRQLNNASKELKINLDAKDAVNGIDSLNSSMLDTSLTFQAANEIFSTSIDIISSMVDQVFELDTALTE